MIPRSHEKYLIGGGTSNCRSLIVFAIRKSLFKAVLSPNADKGFEEYACKL
jgi:hypothetical protein